MTKYCNRKYFETIDTEEKAYFLGFMFADGYVVQDKRHIWRVGLELHKRDKNIIKRFSRALCSEHPICQKRGRETVYIQIGSKEMAQDLIKHGCVPRKSLILKFPTTVPEHLLRHFIRGYSDGDGCVYWNFDKKFPTSIRCDWKLLGTKEFLEGVAEVLEKNLDVKSNIRKQDNIYQIQIRRNVDFYKCLDWLYKDANKTLYLKRKFDKFETWKEERKKMEVE